ncbi:uncharacterized protein [Rutidosis leptorrhynchoides]|uniref:uncharacterized protein n=1 Tax=Rutidosis leptorrhynchoides TaxID=125765 RepID=UPI003A99E74C
MANYTGCRPSIVRLLPISCSFKCPQVAEGLRRKFFWGGTGDNSKISWIKWESVLLPYEGRGLNIGSLKAKNLSLLGKWWWRFHNEKDAFWVKVIQSLYGWDEGLGSHVLALSRNRKSTWNEIRPAGTSIDEINIYFTNSFVKTVNQGDNTRFWKDLWIGNHTLAERFDRLFRLESNEDVLVMDRLIKNEHNGDWNVSWNWSRPL